MRVKKLRVYDKSPERGVSNLYPTSKDAIRQPALHMVAGQRNSGKSYLCSKMLAQFKKDNTFDVVYLISPSFCSNRSYFGKYIKESDCLPPTKSSIQEIISRVEADRDEFEQFLVHQKNFAKFNKELQTKQANEIEPGLLMQAYDNGFMLGPPKWKYAHLSNGKVQPPRSLLILDDVLGSPALLQSAGLTKIGTLNRHIAPLAKSHSDRSACALAVIILCQSYRMKEGISRVLRENLSALTIFATRQKKQYDALEEEIADVVDVDLFRTAYDYSTKDKHGNLTIDFNPVCNSKRFRKNLNQVLLFDEMPCECPK